MRCWMCDEILVGSALCQSYVADHPYCAACYLDFLRSDPPIDPETGNYAVHSAPIVEVSDANDHH
jgi:hypothetical protein